MSADMFVFDPESETIIRKISTGYFQPKDNPHQNLHTVNDIFVNETHTQFSFTIDNKNCFNSMFDLRPKSMWMNYAMGELPFQYHGPDYRGSLKIDPIAAVTEESNHESSREKEEDLQSIELRMPEEEVIKITDLLFLFFFFVQ